MPEMFCFVSSSACFVDQTFVARMHECCVTYGLTSPTVVKIPDLSGNAYTVFWIDFSNFVRRNIFREFILTLKYVYFGFPKDNDVTKKDFIISLTQATSFHCKFYIHNVNSWKGNHCFLSFIGEFNTYMRSIEFSSNSLALDTCMHCAIQAMDFYEVTSCFVFCMQLGYVQAACCCTFCTAFVIIIIIIMNASHCTLQSFFSPVRLWQSGQFKDNIASLQDSLFHLKNRLNNSSLFIQQHKLQQIKYPWLGLQFT